MGAIFLSVGVEGYKQEREEAITVQMAMDIVGDISMSSCWIQHGYRWLHVEILVDM